MIRRVIAFAVIAMAHAVALQAQQSPAAQQAAAPQPGTDIWLARLSTTGIEQPINVTNHPGYDNQPSFTPDGKGFLFTRSEPTSPQASAGQAQTDIYFYDFTARSSEATRITNTPESEYSATVTPDGQGISVIRVEPGAATAPGAQGIQRLWRFTRDGQNPTVILKNVQPVGYHAWGPDGQLALFVLGTPNTLQVADSRTGRSRIVTQRIGRSIHRIPGRDTISVLHVEGDVRTIKELDVKTRMLKPIVRALQTTEGDYAWTPDGAILMSDGKQLMKWSGGEWSPFANLEAMGIRGASRMAVSPDGRWLAIVANEQIMQNTGTSDGDLLTLLDRFADAWNRHDLDALMSMMTDDCVFAASAGPQADGQRSEGKHAVRAAYAAVFETFPDAHWGNARHFIAGDRGVSEWTFTGTQKDGTRVEVTGCDLFTFRDGKIAIKNSYRKNRPAS
jgi:steroid delta-isomerase-like uncharacterized protein